MKTTPYWSETARAPRFLPLPRDLQVDVAIVGGGITGVTAAYLLSQAGASVALVERDRFGGGETGHTTAHLTCVTDVRLRALVKTFGRDHAQAAWDAGVAALSRDFARIIKLIEDGHIDTQPWITHHARFEEVPEIFPTSLKLETGVIKAVVTVD